MGRLAILSLMFTGALAADPLRITVYNQAQVGREVLDDAFEQLQRVFRMGEIEVALAHGDPNNPEASLIVDSAPVRAAEVGCPRRDVAVQITSAPGTFNARVLGLSLPESDVGLNVLVFADHVRDTAIWQHVPFAALLAGSIAHEIGHVLLGTEAHTSYGLMAGSWNRHQYESIGNGALLFTREQYKRMRAGLVRAGCP